MRTPTLTHTTRALLAGLAAVLVALSCASAARADACKAVWRTVGDNYGNQHYLKVTWCYNGSKVTSHTWNRGHAEGPGQAFGGFITNQGGGNGLSYYTLSSDVIFSSQTDPFLEIQVNGQGNYNIRQSPNAHWLAGN